MLFDALPHNHETGMNDRQLVSAVYADHLLDLEIFT